MNAIIQPAEKPVAPSSMTGRQDLDQRVRVAVVDPRDRVFPIFTHDALAEATVRVYASMAYRKGAPIAMVESALQMADYMAGYADKRLVNDDDLADDQRHELTNAFGRRAWRALDDNEDPRILLAQHRAYAELLGLLRPILRVLLEHGAWVDGKFVYDPDPAGYRQPGQMTDLPVQPQNAITALASIDRELRVAGDGSEDDLQRRLARRHELPGFLQVALSDNCDPGQLAKSTLEFLDGDTSLEQLLAEGAR